MNFVMLELVERDKNGWEQCENIQKDLLQKYEDLGSNGPDRVVANEVVSLEIRSRSCVLWGKFVVRSLACTEINLQVQYAYIIWDSGV